MEHHPLDDCTLFMPRDKGPEGTYSLLLRGRGWSDCDADQNAFLQANKSAHVPASKLRQTEDDDEHTSWGGMAAFNVFVVGGITREVVSITGPPRRAAGCFSRLGGFGMAPQPVLRRRVHWRPA